MSSNNNNNDFAKCIDKTAFAFRGYNVTNLGRSPELLAHPAYGKTVAEALTEASEVCSATIGRRVDLVARVRDRLATTLDTFAEDIAMIVGMSVAHLRLLERFFDVPVREARLSFGYSIGELNALVLGGVYEMAELLPVPLSLASDCAALAKDVTMGVLFTRGPMLDLPHLQRLCAKVSCEGKGVIAPSSYLAPNAVLLLGENGALSRFQRLMGDELPQRTYLRRNRHKWPPLHTPLLWRRAVPNRSALALYGVRGGFCAPNPPVVSCVTGKASYNDFNSREHLVRWVDHPQLLWDVIYETLAAGVKRFIHVGPEPNLIPSTYKRISSNVSEQLGRKYMRLLGHRMIASLTRHAWMGKLLSSSPALLRAPFVEHVILEDWLLEHQPE